jgi:hypothetical protein
MRAGLILAAISVLTIVPLSVSECRIGAAADAQRNCCRVCSKGKACGNSCIARDRVCRQPQGCACDAR